MPQVKGWNFPSQGQAQVMINEIHRLLSYPLDPDETRIERRGDGARGMPLNTIRENRSWQLYSNIFRRVGGGFVIPYSQTVLLEHEGATIMAPPLTRLREVDTAVHDVEDDGGIEPAFTPRGGGGGAGASVAKVRG